MLIIVSIVLMPDVGYISLPYSIRTASFVKSCSHRFILGILAVAPKLDIYGKHWRWFCVLRLASCVLRISFRAFHIFSIFVSSTCIQRHMLVCGLHYTLSQPLLAVLDNTYGWFSCLQKVWPGISRYGWSYGWFFSLLLLRQKHSQIGPLH
jgi:hypothetical protein